MKNLEQIPYKESEGYLEQIRSTPPQDREEKKQEIASSLGITLERLKSLIRYWELKEESRRQESYEDCRWADHQDRMDWRFQ